MPKETLEGADVEEMLSTEVEAVPEPPSDSEPKLVAEPLGKTGFTVRELDEPKMVLVRCLAPVLKKSNHKRCYRADTFMESEEWVKAHEADLERL